jgi:hypothetical protein
MPLPSKRVWHPTLAVARTSGHVLRMVKHSKNRIESMLESLELANRKQRDWKNKNNKVTNGHYPDKVTFTLDG